MTASCIYEGTIRHRRYTPRREFSHRLALVYLDLDELPELLGGRLLSRFPGALRFRRQDYHGDCDVPLRRSVRETLTVQTGARPSGPIRILTQLRSFGICFNPVSFYYAFDGTAGHAEAVMAEVTNTPWGERQAYAWRLGDDGSTVLGGAFEKALHVSPFMAMDHSYHARATTPGDTLSVHIESSRAGIRVFDATLALSRRELTRASVARMTARYPFSALRILGLIYAHALALKLAGVPVHPHVQPGRG